MSNTTNNANKTVWPSGITPTGMAGTVTISGGAGGTATGGNITITTSGIPEDPPALSDKEKFFQGQFRCYGKNLPVNKKNLSLAEKTWRTLTRKKVNPVRLDVDTELVRLGLAGIIDGQVRYRDPDDSQKFYAYGDSDSPFGWETFSNPAYGPADWEIDLADNQAAGQMRYDTTSGDVLYFDGTDWYTVTT